MPDIKLVEEMQGRGINLWEQVAWGILENRRLLDEKNKTTAANWKDKPRTQHMQASAVGSFWQGLVAALAKQGGSPDNLMDAQTIVKILEEHGCFDEARITFGVDRFRATIVGGGTDPAVGDGEPAPLPADAPAIGVPQVDVPNPPLLRRKRGGKDARGSG